MQVIVDAEQSTAIFELLSLFGYCVFKFSTKDSLLLNCCFFGDIGCLFNSYRQRRIKPHKKSQKVSYKALKVIQEYTKAYKESDKHPENHTKNIHRIRVWRSAFAWADIGLPARLGNLCSTRGNSCSGILSSTIPTDIFWLTGIEKGAIT